MGVELGRQYVLSQLLHNGKRMLRVGRETDNDIVLKEDNTSFISRHHFTLELDRNGVTWYVRDGQWNVEQKQWIPSTNGTYLGPVRLGTDRTKITVGEVITTGNIKILIETI